MDIFHILRCTEKRSNADIVFIVTVANQHTSRLYIIGSQGILNIGYGDSRNGEFFRIRHYLEHSSRYPGDVCHGHFGQLLDAAFHYIFSQFAQGKELLFVHLFIRTAVLQRHIEIQHRDVRCTCLDSLRTFRFLWEAVHGRINLLVHLDERQVGVHTEIELQTDDACTVTGLALDFTKSRYLQQLSAHRSHYRILQFSCR